ncbi:GNAT family N-acetyltransferase [Natronosalvus vescus]|uniref:GNAT family N-acetyltransferase n=1 Tax=Natronosalvus vescus TaxID=2953881 RepID=UPI0020912E22|nr:GNAT family N-acetyltransferase [Natronosalvus vescus]
MTDTDDITIEPATPDDLEAITELWVRLAINQRQHGSHVHAESNRETMQALLRAHQVDGGLLVARHRGSIVGFASFSVEHGSLDLDCTRGLLSNLYVDPALRGQGLGSRLLEAVESDLVERGVDVISLEAMAANEAARQFYRQAGYTPFRIGFERRLEGSMKNDTHSKDEG